MSKWILRCAQNDKQDGAHTLILQELPRNSPTLPP
jgi:hypothetical protein